jgi:hypothetical protein
MNEIVVTLTPLMRAYIESEAAARGHKDIPAFAQILIEEAIQRQRVLKEENKSSLAP